ncbi:MAG TPA: phosphate signaling complex protein PhoU [Candidatus Dormibacteraeota bacterium]|jgi:phosphate transport system protein|nr:phosphate signaling complex protein PhoU [Candidatus Dormibacteraeota bacterium]
MSDIISHPQRSVFDEELRTTRLAVTEMGELVDRAISGAMVGLMERDVDACAVVIAEDARINELQREVREQSYTMILTQAPVARDLREIMGLLHMSAELERMGDHCVSIAKIARSLADFPELATHVDLPKMAQFCREQVGDILAAVVARDVPRARLVAARDDRIDRVYHRLFDELVQLMSDDGQAAYRATNLVFVAHHLERIADRVTNIAEDLVYLETGVIEELG